MQKKLRLLFFFFLCALSLKAQDCSNPVLTHTILTDNIRATIGRGGGIWRQPYTTSPQLDPGVEVYPFFAGGLWLGGLDEEGNLKLAASTYGDFSEEFDYYPGPVNTQGQTNPTLCENMEHFWPITQTDIELFLIDFEDGNLDQFHTNIMRWPARGNPFFQDIFGFVLPVQDLAPFVDQNGDGFYNPLQGDYPAMKGDEAVWWVFNDLGGEHRESFGEPIGAEVQVMAYTFQNQSNNISKTSFYDLKIINRSDEPLDSFYTSLFFDFDLGCYTDDYMGCIPEENLAFVYNVDAVDGSTGCSCENGVNSYCEEIPLFGVKIINSPYNDQGEKMGMTSYILHHSGAVDWPIGMISPYEPQGFYNYMKGFWRDGTPLTYGGDGYFENGEITTYAFPDNPSDPDGWSMCSENMPWGDRRTVMGTGPVYFAPGEVLEFTYALLFVPDVPHPCPDVTPLIEAGQEVQDLFDQITGYEVLEMESEKVYFHPNPMRDMARLALKQPGNRIANLTLYNASGMKLRQYNSVFRGNLHIYRENLPAGIYFYQLETENGARYSGKIIMQ